MYAGESGNNTVKANGEIRAYEKTSPDYNEGFTEEWICRKTGLQ